MRPRSQRKDAETAAHKIGTVREEPMLVSTSSVDEQQYQQQPGSPPPTAGPFEKLSDLNDHLLSIDIGSFLTLRSLLESRFGRGGHLSVNEMAEIKKMIAEIGQLYVSFSKIVETCVRNRMESRSHPKQNSVMSLGRQVDEPGSPVSVASVTPSLPPSLANDPPDDTIYGTTKVVKVTIETKNEKKQPAEVITDDKLAELVQEALVLHDKITSTVTRMNHLVEEHRNFIDPQTIINETTEVGFLQRFFVRSRYKEMVKGCGSGRRLNSTKWAGWRDPGDSWMNDLINCYWRHRDKTLDVPHRPSQDEEHTEIDDDARLKYELATYKAMNETFLDVVDIVGMMRWMKQSRIFPHMYTYRALHVIEEAVFKMGGWRFVHVFCLNWLRQFYVEFGHTSVAYPLPGCRLWAAEGQSTHDSSFSRTPLSLSLQKLHEIEVPESPAIDIKMAAGLIQTPKTADERYWNQLWASSCKDLLTLHLVLREEFGTGTQVLKSWMVDVRSSGILEGKYKLFGEVQDSAFDRHLLPYQKRLLHPQLVNIREKAIVVNAFMKPETFRHLKRLEREIRDTFNDEPDVPETVSDLMLNKSTGSLSSHKSSKQEGARFKKGHKKSASAGVFDAAQRLFRRKTKSVSDTNISMEEDQRITLPRPTRLNISTSSIGGRGGPGSPTKLKERSLSAPANVHDHIDVATMDFSEIKALCLEIVKQPALLDEELAIEAFKLSEIVVKHYLSDELPAKYQSAY